MKTKPNLLLCCVRFHHFFQKNIATDRISTHTICKTLKWSLTPSYICMTWKRSRLKGTLFHPFRATKHRNSDAEFPGCSHMLNWLKFFFCCFSPENYAVCMRLSKWIVLCPTDLNHEVIEVRSNETKLVWRKAQQKRWIEVSTLKEIVTSSSPLVTWRVCYSWEMGWPYLFLCSVFSRCFSVWLKLFYGFTFWYSWAFSDSLVGLFRKMQMFRTNPSHSIRSPQGIHTFGVFLTNHAREGSFYIEIWL